jgi:hypothetical protein
MLGEPAAHDGIGLEVGERVEQRLRAAALMELPEGVGSDHVILLQEREELTSAVVAEKRHDPPGRVRVLVDYERHVDDSGQPK